MTPPNASLAARLQIAPAYAVIPDTYKASWLATCQRLPPSHLEYPKEGEVFDGEHPNKQCLERLNNYGFANGCFFVSGKSKLKNVHTKSYEFKCKYHDLKTMNKGDLESEVEYDSEDNRTTLRERNVPNHKKGCPVRYLLSERKTTARGEDGPRQWIGRWTNEGPHQQYHKFPSSFHKFTKLKRLVNEYKALEVQGRKWRIGRIPYKRARIMFKEAEGTDMLMSRKEYYNLAQRPIKDISWDDTAPALCAVFEDAQWKYRTRERIDQDTGKRKIIQIFFWADKTRDLIRRFTSNALLIVDATFRTNRKGLPLIIAVGKSNNDQTFPVAFSWVPEEDADSYAEFFECLREEIYNDIPEPAVVLSDLSAGMTSAYDTLKCLPNSKLQYCNWHAVVSAMKKHWQSGRYTSEEVEHLVACGWSYVMSNTEGELEINRQTLINMLLPVDQKYIRDSWVPREPRLIRCYTKFFTNLGSEATQRLEGYNADIHRITHHQMTMIQAAREIISSVDDFYRDLGHENERTQDLNIPGIDKYAFTILSRCITAEALQQLNKQWKLLIKDQQGILRPPRRCTGSFRKQHLLPCSHDLKPFYDSGLPVVKSMVHPRYWIEGFTLPTANWQPSYETVLPIVASPTRRHLQAQFQDIIEAREGLSEEAQRESERRLGEYLAQERARLLQRHEHEARPQELPDERPRASKKAIPIASESLTTQYRKAAREVARQAEDERILNLRAAESQGGTTINVSIDILTHRPKAVILGPIHDISNSESSEAENEPTLIPDTPPRDPPPSTAPPRLEGRGKRARGRTLDYAKLDAGDSQEYKKAKGSRR